MAEAAGINPPLPEKGINGPILVGIPGTGHEPTTLFLIKPIRINGRLLTEVQITPTDYKPEEKKFTGRALIFTSSQRKNHTDAETPSLLLNINSGDTIEWEKFAGVRLVDARGESVLYKSGKNKDTFVEISKDQLSTTRPQAEKDKSTQFSAFTPAEAQAYNNMMANSGEEPDEIVATTNQADTPQNLTPNDQQGGLTEHPDQQPDLTTPPANPLTGATTSTTSSPSIAPLPIP